MSILNWIEDKKRRKVLNVPKHFGQSADSSKGLWTRCDKCGIILYIKHLKENQRVCFGCSYHLQMMSQERIENLLDKVPALSPLPAKRFRGDVRKEDILSSSPFTTKKPKIVANTPLPLQEGVEQQSTPQRSRAVDAAGPLYTTLRQSGTRPAPRESMVSTWRPLDETVSPCDPLRFKDQKSYRDRLQDTQERTGLQDAIQTGTGMIDGIPVALAVMDFSFMGGSMGSVVGEKITRLIEYATGEGLTLLIVSASGGARMQEGVFSLMQMAKISSALHIYQSCAKLLYISILTSPTTGGVTASFAMLGDIIFAEPKALIAFAGRRVIEQTLSEHLPDDFQTSEYMLHHGLVDLIVPRRFLRQAVSESIRLYQNAPFKKRGEIPFGVQNPISFLTEEKIRRSWGVLTKQSGPRQARSFRSTSPSFKTKPSAEVASKSAHSFFQTDEKRAAFSSFCRFSDRGTIKQDAYRKILSSFEIMLDLFVSGNMKKEGSSDKSLFSASFPKTGSYNDREISSYPSQKEFNFRYKTAFLRAKTPLSFWIYNGIILGNQRAFRAKAFSKIDGQLKHLTPYKQPKLCRSSQNQFGKNSKMEELLSTKSAHLVDKKGKGDNGSRVDAYTVSFSREGREKSSNGSSNVKGVLLPCASRERLGNTFALQKCAKPCKSKQSKSFICPVSSKGVRRGLLHGPCNARRYLTARGLYQKLAGDLYNNCLQDLSTTPYSGPVPQEEGLFPPSSKTDTLYSYLQGKAGAEQRDKETAKNKQSTACKASVSGKCKRRQEKTPLSRHFYQRRRVALKNKRLLQSDSALSYKAVFGACTKGANHILSVFDKEARTVIYKKFFTSRKLATLVKLVCNKVDRISGDNKDSFLVGQTPLQFLLSQELSSSRSNPLATQSLVPVWGAHLASKISLFSQNGAYKSEVFGRGFAKRCTTLQKNKARPLKQSFCNEALLQNELDRSSLLQNFRVISEGKHLVKNISINRSAIGVNHTNCFGQESNAYNLDKNKRVPTFKKPLITHFTSRKANLAFFNQAIELAATESVQWRAFYIYQQLSENTGFLEDFLKRDLDSQNKSGNILFYKSICRSEKALDN